MKKERNFQVISNFIMKIFALVLMTIDHVGIFLQNYENTLQIGNIFRNFGRLAFPIFIFIIVEGVRHTRHFGKYILKLGILATVFLIGQVVFFYFIDNSIQSFYSPVLDATIIALIIYLLKRKDKFSLFAIIPIAFIITSFVVVNLEIKQDINILWFPFFLRLPYALFDLCLALGFFYAKPIARAILKNGGSAVENLLDTPYERYTENIINAFVILFFTFLFFIIYKTTSVSYMFVDYQAFAALSCLLFLFYNGERGYDKTWFKYGAYLYIPLHIAIIYLIFLFI